MTATVTVTKGTVQIISAVGLFEDESYIVLRKGCTSCDVDTDDDWIIFKPNGKDVVLDSKVNPIILTLPGVYKVEPYGVVNCNAKVCAEAVERCCGETYGY